MSALFSRLLIERRGIVAAGVVLMLMGHLRRIEKLFGNGDGGEDVTKKKQLVRMTADREMIA